MFRTFHSIGQGAFYTEIFLKEGFPEFTVVYDCGTDSSQKILKNEIKATFKKDQKINLLFISHFHHDHISGLESLLDHCKVEYIVLPLMEKEHKVFAYIDNYYGKGISMKKSKVKEDIFDLSSFLDNKLEDGTIKQIIYVRPEHDHDGGEIVELSNSDLAPYNKIFTIDSGTKLILRNYGPYLEYSYTFDWQFIPFNFEHSSRSESFKKSLNSQGIYIESTEELIEYLREEKNRDTLKKIYESVNGNLNANSLTLYSGEVNSRNHFIGKVCKSSRIDVWNRRVYNSGCLYLGDYNAKKEAPYEKLKDKYKDVWSRIGIIQIPHHGSKYNFDPELLTSEDRRIMYIISVGYKNRHRHPHHEIITGLAMKHLNFFCINEYKGSELIVQY